MPTPAIALKLRKFRRRFGITASRVVVRTHLPWQWWALFALLLSILVAVGTWFALQQNEGRGIGRQVDALRQEFQAQRDELDLLRSTADTGQSAVSIERAAQHQLLVRVHELERENGALKEDILLFERLMPTVGEDGLVRVESFRVTREAGTGYRYRLLLAFQPNKQSPEFRGRLELAVNFVLAGKVHQLLLPDKKRQGAESQLELKRFLRREGAFELPPGAELKVVEARVLQGDTLKSKRQAQL